MLMSLTLSVKSNEPVDIWSIENKEEKKTIEDTLDNDVQQSINNLTNSKEDEIAIEQDTIEINKKIVGLYDPSDNGFMMNMWKNSDPKKVFNLSNKINKMKLSDDAKSIYTKLLLTNTYSPVIPEDEKIFFDIKSEWLMKYKDVELIEDYVFKNIDIIPNEKLIKFIVDELLAENKNKQACEILDKIKINFNNNYLKNFNIYCLTFLKKKEEAILSYDLEKESGYKDPFFEKKLSYLFEYTDEELSTSDKDLLSLHLSYLTNKKFVYVPSEKTTKLYWRYLSSNNLLGSINDVNLEDDEEVFLLEKATHDQNYDENELFNLYKRFQFSIDQLLNVESEHQKLSKIKSRALLYQGILLTNNANDKIKLCKTLKNSFIQDNISLAFNKELKTILKQYELEDLSSELTNFYEVYTDANKKNNKIKYNNKILHQSKLVKYFSDETISKKKIEKDLNNFLKKVKKSKKNFLVTKDIILIEAMVSDGINVSEEFKYLYTLDDNSMPTDIQILINDDETGMAILRLIEIIGEDNIKDLGSETLYFVINALNQMDIDPIRNEILYNILPLRA